MRFRCIGRLFFVGRGYLGRFVGLEWLVGRPFLSLRCLTYRSQYATISSSFPKTLQLAPLHYLPLHPLHTYAPHIHPPPKNSTSSWIDSGAKMWSSAYLSYSDGGHLICCHLRRDVSFPWVLCYCSVGVVPCRQGPFLSLLWLFCWWLRTPLPPIHTVFGREGIPTHAHYWTRQVTYDP